MRGPEEFPGKRLQEVFPPNPYEQRRAEEQYRFKAGAPLPRPIDLLLQVKPERKFIQRKSRPDTIKQRHQSAREQRGPLRACAYFYQPAKANHEQKQYPPDEVMNMRAADINVMKRTNIVPGGISGPSRQR